MPAVTETIFQDLVAREDKARPDLENQRNSLTRLFSDTGQHPRRERGNRANARLTAAQRRAAAAQEAALNGFRFVPRPNLTEEERAALKRINELLALGADVLLDPMFVAVREAFNDDAVSGLLSDTLADHEGGVLVGDNDDLTDADVVRVALVMGHLAEKKVKPPRLRVDDPKKPTKAVVDTSDPLYSAFTAAFFAALGRARGSADLAELVLPILQLEGDSNGDDDSAGEVNTEEFARVMTCLEAKKITAAEAQLRRRINECLNTIQNVGAGDSVANTVIELPDLNGITDYNIQAANVVAIGPMICAAMFDELKAFEVVDKIVEAAQMGTLTTSVSDAGAAIYEYWKSAPNRMSDAERRNFYALTMGIPGGSANGSANRDFNDLWIRFVSSVSSVVRQKTADHILRANIPASISQQQVRKAARDLALNLSAHGYGMVQYAARDLQIQINQMIHLLGHEDIKRAYGAYDMWQVIDQVATLELGGARNSARYRTLATCGAIITRWLSQNIEKFNSTTTLRPVIDVNEVLSSDPRSAGPDATKRPTDYDLVNACELWLADTAVSDDRIEEFSQPREAPAMTSRPVQIPSIARELLDEALPPGLGLGMGMHRR
jgi:hypothetical protein